MTHETVETVAGLLILFVFWMCWSVSAKKLFYWLKGSRTSYYFRVKQEQDFEIYITKSSLRESSDFTNHTLSGHVIEINRGPFRRSSTIRGVNRSSWYIAKDWRWVDGDGRDCVSLTDNHGLRVEVALQIVNAYPSLHAMLDENRAQKNRISELEKELKSRPTQLELQTAKDNLFLANERREEWNAGVTAVLRVIERDRQYFRSKAAQNTRECLEALLQGQKDRAEPEADSDKVQRWDNAFHRLIYY